MEYKSAYRNKALLLQPLLFLILIVILFVFVIDEGIKSNQLVSGIVWVGVLLSIMLSLESKVILDHQSGVVEQFILSPYPLANFALIKIISHWLFFCAPILCFMPLLAFLIQLKPLVILVLMLSIWLGSLYLICIGQVLANITIIASKKAATLIFVLLAPLYIPALIFGHAVTLASINGISFLAPLLLLCALSLSALAITPLMLSFVWRLHYM